MQHNGGCCGPLAGACRWCGVVALEPSVKFNQAIHQFSVPPQQVKRAPCGL